MTPVTPTQEVRPKDVEFVKMRKTGLKVFPDMLKVSVLGVIPSVIFKSCTVPPTSMYNRTRTRIKWDVVIAIVPKLGRDGTPASRTKQVSASCASVGTAPEECEARAEARAITAMKLGMMRDGGTHPARVCWKPARKGNKDDEANNKALPGPQTATATFSESALPRSTHPRALERVPEFAVEKARESFRWL